MSALTGRWAELWLWAPICHSLPSGVWMRCESWMKRRSDPGESDWRRCYPCVFFSLHNIGVIARLEGIMGIMNAYDTVNFKKSFIITAVGIEKTCQPGFCFIAIIPFSAANGWCNTAPLCPCAVTALKLSPRLCTVKRNTLKETEMTHFPSIK